MFTNLSTREIVKRGGLPRIRLIRWTRRIRPQGKTMNMTVYSVIERTNNSPSGFRYCGSNENVEGTFHDVDNMAVPLSDNSYVPIHIKGRLGSGINLVCATAQQACTPGKVVDNAVACYELLLKHHVVEKHNNQLRLVVRTLKPDYGPQGPAPKVRLDPFLTIADLNINTCVFAGGC